MAFALAWWTFLAVVCYRHSSYRVRMVNVWIASGLHCRFGPLHLHLLLAYLPVRQVLYAALIYRFGRGSNVHTLPVLLEWINPVKYHSVLVRAEMVLAYRSKWLDVCI
jgi:hypothetical protein